MSAESILQPALPFDMRARAAKSIGDVRLRQFVETATLSKDTKRALAFQGAFGERHQAVRELASSIKRHTLDHLDHYLEAWVERAEAAGIIVHFAADAVEANRICLEIATREGCRRCVKSKSMVTEETRLLPALEAAGIEVVETDLGEFIVQLDGDAPSHIVTPMIHKDRTATARAFVRELGEAYTEDPRELTMIARRHLRKKYREADLGISGGNFLVAEDGSVVICTNEGNGDFCVSGPRVHVAMVGIEKLVPRGEDLGVLLKVLARSSTAQALTVYTTVLRGPRREGEGGGPERMHVILLDNGRTELLRAETRELLKCIRCGACLNACPVFRSVGGGHAYGAVYSGPIGAVLTPELKGLANYADLPRASSLCGACGEVCPVKIDIPGQLVRLRGELVRRKIESRWVVGAMRAWARVLRSPAGYAAATLVQRTVLRGIAETEAGDRGRAWVGRGFGPLGEWTKARDFPAPAAQSFRAWWAANRGAGGGSDGGVGGSGR